MLGNLNTLKTRYHDTKQTPIKRQCTNQIEASVKVRTILNVQNIVRVVHQTGKEHDFRAELLVGGYVAHL